MAIIPEAQDAFGKALLDYLASRDGPLLLLEADDGSAGPAMEPAWFFQNPEAWYHWEKKALDLLEGPVPRLFEGTGWTLREHHLDGEDHYVLCRRAANL